LPPCSEMGVIMLILNIAGYKFIALNELAQLKSLLLEVCSKQQVKGTILLSQEGINISLAGQPQDIQAFQSFLQADDRFSDMTFHETYSNALPFRTLKVKLKGEIITLRQPEVNPHTQRAPCISPIELKQWLDEERDITLLDTRNDYEVHFGTFKGAVNLHIDHFGEFPQVVNEVERDKPIVMFCTGGIRCEKAAFYMLQKGFQEVYQLEGGILGYFSAVGGTHYEGECFVFDGRIALGPDMQKTGTLQCQVCQGPIDAADQPFTQSSKVICIQCYNNFPST